MFGVMLFMCINCGIVLMVVGQWLFVCFGVIFGECEQVEWEICQLSGVYEGIVMFGFVIELLIDVFVLVLIVFCVCFDKVDVYLCIGMLWMMIGWLCESVVDFVIVLVVKQIDMIDFVVMLLCMLVLVVVCCNGYLVMYV